MPNIIYTKNNSTAIYNVLICNRFTPLYPTPSRELANSGRLQIKLSQAVVNIFISQDESDILSYWSIYSLISEVKRWLIYLLISYITADHWLIYLLISQPETDLLAFLDPFTISVSCIIIIYKFSL